MAPGQNDVDSDMEEGKGDAGLPSHPSEAVIEKKNEEAEAAAPVPLPAPAAAFESMDDAALSLGDLMVTTGSIEVEEEEGAMTDPESILPTTMIEGDASEFRITPMKSNRSSVTGNYDRLALLAGEEQEGNPLVTPPAKSSISSLMRVPSIVKPPDGFPSPMPSPLQAAVVRQLRQNSTHTESSDGGMEGSDGVESLADVSADLHRVRGSLTRGGEMSSSLTQDLSDSQRVLFQNNKRMSLTVDLETGKEGGGRTHCALVRASNLCEAQSVGTRRRLGLKNIFSTVKTGKEAVKEYIREGVKINKGERNADVLYLPGHHNYTVRSRQVEDHDSGDDSDPSTLSKRRIKTQFTLQGSTTNNGKGPFKRIARALGVSKGSGIYEESPTYQKAGFSIFGFRPNEFVINYLNWAFRSSFLAVFVSAAFAFIFETVFFALLIMISGYEAPQCIHINGIEFGESDSHFWDAYALSWTTFSTVGYGLVYPSTTATAIDVGGCLGITILTTFESFVGILFGSLWGAILFAKVSRTLSFAQVTFSDPIVIRYGSGVASEDDDDKSSNAKGDGGDTPSSKVTAPKKLPCPLLEFRVINRLHGQRGGEIIDATMNIVASIDESHASQSLMKENRDSIHFRGKKRRRRKKQQQKVNLSSGISSMRRRGSRAGSHHGSGRSSMANFFSSRSHHKAQVIDEDPTGKIVPKRVFVKLLIESPDHPFFKRVWIARHVLDHQSPLLTHEAREMIRLNGGHWPEELNNAAAVRQSVHFHKILVSLSGTSNVDAKSVYAQHVYDFVDLCVGYRFCNLLFRHEGDGSLGVDPSLLSDVTEQMGGGGESLSQQKDKELADIFIL